MEHTTIYGAVPAFREIVAAIRSCTDLPLQLTGTEDNWSQLVLTAPRSTLKRGRWGLLKKMAEQFVPTAPASTLKLSPLVFGKPQDKFSKIILGTWNFARQIDTSHTEAKEQLIG